MEILFLIVGLPFVGVALFLWVELRAIRQSGRPLLGQVVAYMRKAGDKKERQKFYHAIVKVQAPNGIRYVKSSVGSGVPMVPLGARARVFVSATDPRLALVDSNAMIWLPAIFGAIGAASVVIFFVTFRFDWLFALGALYLAGQFAYLYKKKHKDFARAVAAFHEYRDRSLFETMMTQEEFDSILQVEPAQIHTAFALRKRQAAVGAVIMILLGCGMIAGGERWYQSRSTFLGQAERAKGKVTEWHISRGSESTAYYPVVTYRHPASAQEIRFKHSVGSSHPSWRIGDEVDVLYSPYAPSEAMIDQGSTYNHAGPLALVAVGILFLLLGLKSALYRAPQPVKY